MNRISGLKPLVIYIIIAVLAVAGGIFYFTGQISKPGENTVLTPDPKVSYKTYSMGGSVVTVSADQIIFSAPVVVQKASGNVVEYRVKTALVDTHTVFEANTKKGVSIKDLKPGMYINVYYSSDPLSSDSLLADRVTF